MKLNALAVLLLSTNLYAVNLTFSTYLGGTGDDYSYGIDIDSTNSVYVSGTTNSTNFPTTTGLIAGTLPNVFVTKLDSLAENLVYSSQLGGIGIDISNGVKVDSGFAYISGETESDDFPTTSGVFGETYYGGTEAFAVKLSQDGSFLVYSTYLGGTSASSPDFSRQLEVKDGFSFVVGDAGSFGFPVTAGAFDEQHETGGSDVFITKLSLDATALEFSTFLGGGSEDSGFEIAVFDDSTSVVTGRTESNNFPTTSSAFDTTYNGSDDSFVTRLNSDGTALVFSNYLGSTSLDYSFSIAKGLNNSTLISGRTQSLGFPTTPGAYDQNLTGINLTDGFVTKMNADGGSLAFSTYLGGFGEDWGAGIKVDTSGSVYITGKTTSVNFPVTSNAYDNTFNDNNFVGKDAFVTKLSSEGDGLLYSSFFGGATNDGEFAEDIKITAGGTVFITGVTTSSDLPITQTAFNTSLNDLEDAFVARFDSLEVVSTKSETNKPQTFSLSQNYPNPFNPTTTINYELEIANHEFGKLAIFNILGEEVKEFKLTESKGSVTWNGTDSFGKQVSSGTYFYKILTSNNESEVRKMTFLK